MTKVCSSCNIEKESSAFWKKKTGKLGLRAKCKDCLNKDTKRKAAHTRYHHRNKERWYNWHKEYIHTKQGRYSSYKSDAKRRNYEWKLSFKDFEAFWQKPCFYCGDSIESIGLDRIDNNLGYIIKNLVPCCTRCNKAKHTASSEEFIEMCKKIASLHSKQ